MHYINVHPKPDYSQVNLTHGTKQKSNEETKKAKILRRNSPVKVHGVSPETCHYHTYFTK